MGLVVWLSVRGNLAVPSWLLIEQVTREPPGPGLVPGICTGHTRGCFAGMLELEEGPLPLWVIDGAPPGGTWAPRERRRAGRPGPGLDFTCREGAGHQGRLLLQAEQCFWGQRGLGAGWDGTVPAARPLSFPGSARPCCRHPAPP